MAPSSALRSSYRNRRSDIKKKTEELAILCDVEAFAIIMGPDGGYLMTWPENHSQQESVIAKYRNHSVGNQAKKNPEKKKKKWVLSDWDDSWLDGLVGDSLLDFSNSVRVKIEQVKKRAEVLKPVDGEKIQQENHNDQLFVNAMEIHAETEPLFNQTVMLLRNGEKGGFTFAQRQASPNDWLNFLHNGETHPSFDLVVNGEKTPNCWVSGEETMGSCRLTWSKVPEQSNSPKPITLVAVLIIWDPSKQCLNVGSVTLEGTAIWENK